MANTTTFDDAISPSYPGGKGSIYQKLINLIPPHRVYVEPFVGMGAVARHKRPAIVNIAIDIDASALELFRCTIAGNGGGAAKWHFLNCDALEWLRSYDWQGDEFIYADPPYLMSTRRQHRQLYRYELATPQEHKRLLDILTVLPCKIMLSGYWSELYDQELAGWHTASFRVRTRSGSWATEWVWMNYPRPVELHDYAHLGKNYRERERIKRKKQRWAAKWQKMDILERQAILYAIADTENNGY